MKPPQEIPENEKSFDGICLEHHPETYDTQFITKCFKLDENTPLIYVKSTHSAIRICEHYYLKFSDYEKESLERRNTWHSIGQIRRFIKVCFFSNIKIMSICRTAFQCTQCIDKFLDNQNLIQNGIEIEI